MADRKKQIRIFNNTFSITSKPLMRDGKQLGWEITIILYKDNEKIKETYQDFAKDVVYAEEASFGYFLGTHCEGGIFWN